jgi:hypothetical protein
MKGKERKKREDSLEDPSPNGDDPEILFLLFDIFC